MRIELVFLFPWTRWLDAFREGKLEEARSYLSAPGKVSLAGGGRASAEVRRRWQ